MGNSLWTLLPLEKGDQVPPFVGELGPHKSKQNNEIEGIETEAKPCEVVSRDWNDAVRSPGIPGATRS